MLSLQQLQRQQQPGEMRPISRRSQVHDRVRRTFSTRIPGMTRRPSRPHAQALHGCDHRGIPHRRCHACGRADRSQLPRYQHTKVR